MLHYIRVTAGPYSGQIYQFETKKEALALERALNRLRPYSTDYGNSRDYFPETHLKNRRASTSPPSLTGRQHATKRSRADDLIASYGTWTSSYSNEDIDRATGLANRLTDIDREEGRSAPPVGFSKARYTQAKRVVDDANRYGEKQQRLHAAGRTHARKKKLSPHEAKQLLQSDAIDFGRNFHELSSSEVQRVLEVARLAGYHKRKDAPGSTARMYFQYLARLK